MLLYKTGDLIARIHPASRKPLQIGLIMCHTKKDFDVQWTYFDKVFFMEKEGDIFTELNKTFLLTTETFYRDERDSDLCLLNPS